MKYFDGQDVKMGDKVKFGEDSGGVVVCSIDTGEYSEAHPESQWGYLKEGVMIDFPLYGLIHYAKVDPEMELVSRSN
jgi:hypothetical protein